MNKKKGIFISFEGPEAVWKSTQLISLKKFLHKRKIPFIFTREPGGTLVSEKLRKIILSNNYSITTTEEILLLMSGRLNHIGIKSRSWLSWQVPIFTEGNHKKSRISNIFKSRILKYLNSGGVPVITGFQGINFENS